MKVILCEDMDHLGEMGETVKVSPGYARNFLLPRRLAVASDSATAHQIEHEMRIIKKREEKRRKELAEVAKGLSGIRVTFKAKAGDSGKLFGSVTNLHIAQKLEEMGHAVSRKKILLADPIKTLGDHAVTVRLKSGIETKINVIVEADVEAPAPVETENTGDTLASAEGEFAAPGTVAASAPAPGELEKPGSNA
jgi:large subunit ribosomal protein L9